MPPNAEQKRTVLRERGWTRISGHGAETWTHPSRGGDHFYTLAAAYAETTRTASGQHALFADHGERG